MSWVLRILNEVGWLGSAIEASFLKNQDWRLILFFLTLSQAVIAKEAGADCGNLAVGFTLSNWFWLIYQSNKGVSDSYCCALWNGERRFLEGIRLCYWAALFSDEITTYASGGLVMTGWAEFYGF